MHRLNQGPNHHFNAYYEDNALLIQFIVGEFIYAFQLFLKIKTLISESSAPRQTTDSALSSMIDLFTQLVGNQGFQEKLSHSQWSKGCLTKLKDYCEQQSRNSKHQKKQHLALHMAAHELWLSALHNLELLQVLNENLQLGKTEYLVVSLKRTIGIIEKRFNQVIRSIPRLINNFLDNENVIQYLLRHQRQLAEIYGTDFFTNVLKRHLAPNAYVEFIVRRYRSRGFVELPQKIEQLLASEEFPNEKR